MKEAYKLWGHQIQTLDDSFPAVSTTYFSLATKAQWKALLDIYDVHAILQYFEYRKYRRSQTSSQNVFEHICKRSEMLFKTGFKYF